jgi:DNA-directed RNA polymerase subunit L
MEVKIIKNDKNHLIAEVENQTIAEVLRVYLNKDSAVELAVWKRVHPDKPITFEIKTTTKAAKKALEDAASVIEKESTKYLDDFKKAAK